jgi:EAL domain-containing protein (putative c-di-GMP-specific phosphodiesterase class I)
VPADARAAAILSAIVAIARQLDLEVVAEGVETEAQYRFLAAAGCESAQGFGLCEPASAASFPDCLQPAWGWS